MSSFIPVASMVAYPPDITTARITQPFPSPPLNGFPPCILNFGALITLAFVSSRPSPPCSSSLFPSPPASQFVVQHEWKRTGRCVVCSCASQQLVEAPLTDYPHHTSPGPASLLLPPHSLPIPVHQAHVRDEVQWIWQG